MPCGFSVSGRSAWLLLDLLSRLHQPKIEAVRHKLVSLQYRTTQRTTGAADPASNKVRTLPIARRPLSKKKRMPRKVKRKPNPVSPMPISAQHRRSERIPCRAAVQRAFVTASYATEAVSVCCSKESHFFYRPCCQQELHLFWLTGFIRQDNFPAAL